MTDHSEREVARRVTIFFDVFYLPHLDTALRMIEADFKCNQTPVGEIGLAEVRALRGDLAKQINQSMVQGVFLPPE